MEPFLLTMLWDGLLLKRNNQNSIVMHKTICFKVIIILHMNVAYKLFLVYVQLIISFDYIRYSHYSYYTMFQKKGASILFLISLVNVVQS